MEVNKGEAERCRDMGADALRRGQHAKAARLLRKSLSLYPLPGVKALLGQAERRAAASSGGGGGGGNDGGGSSNGAGGAPNGTGPSSGGGGAAAGRAAGFASSRSSSNVSAASSNAGAGGRSYTDEQTRMVRQVLGAREGGRGAHYRVLGVPPDADDASLKKAYRKLALRLHPDKNSAPDADEAFKAVGLAYATLSDPRKRAVYDRYGDEDPDNRGGGGGGARRGNMHFHGQEVSPEDLFNMFFGGGVPGGMGGMPGGGAGGFGSPGFRVYTSGFGPGMHQRRGRGEGQPGQGQQQQQGGLPQLLQLLPLIMLFLLSFFNLPGEDGTGGGATGGSPYFSLTHSPPFVNPLKTEIASVKDIPYYVTDKFLRTYHRDRFQLAQVERMVEKSYENYLVQECKNQVNYKRALENNARNRKGLTREDRERLLKKAEEFELTRCEEMEGLFPGRGKGAGAGAGAQQGHKRR